MASTTFVDGVTKVVSNWLNDVNAKVYENGEAVSIFKYFTAAQIADVKARTGLIDVTANLLTATAAGATYAPPGLYTISANIPVTKSLTGAGPGNTDFNIVGSGYDAFTLVNDNSYIDNVGFTSTTARTSGSTVFFAANKRSQRLSKFKTSKQFNPVKVDLGCVISEISSGEILDTTASTGVCIDILGGNDTFINQVIADNSGTEPYAGIRVQKTDALWMTNNDFIHCGNGLEISPNGSLGQYVTWIFGINNAFDSSVAGSGTYISPSNGGSIRGVQLIGHWCSTNLTGMRIITDASTGCIVDGIQLIAPRILNNKQHGLFVDGGAQVVNIEVVDSIISGNGGRAVNTYDGIFFGNDSKLFKVRGGKSGTALGFGASQRYGLNIGSRCTSYEINGIDLTGNSLAAISNNSWTNATGRVNNNYGVSTRITGNSPFSSGATEITITHGLATTPTSAFAIPSNTNLAGVGYWVGSFTPLTFKINFSSPTSGAGSMNWLAEIS